MRHHRPALLGKMARIVDKTPKHLLPARISMVVERFGVALYGQQEV